MRTPEPCLCGATDCPSCGPAQGYVPRLNDEGVWCDPETGEPIKGRRNYDYDEEIGEHRPLFVWRLKW